MRRPPSLPVLVARLADRALAPRAAVRNAAAAAYELSQHTEAWRDGLTAPLLLDGARVSREPAQQHPSLS
jgi:hypothetical protein